MWSCPLHPCLTLLTRMIPENNFQWETCCFHLEIWDQLKLNIRKMNGLVKFHVCVHVLVNKADSNKRQATKHGCFHTRSTWQHLKYIQSTQFQGGHPKINVTKSVLEGIWSMVTFYSLFCSWVMMLNKLQECVSHNIIISQQRWPFLVWKGHNSVLSF